MAIESFPGIESPVEERVEAFLAILTSKGCFENITDKDRESGLSWSSTKEHEFKTDMGKNFVETLRDVQLGDSIVFRNPYSQDGHVKNESVVVSEVTEHNILVESLIIYPGKKVQFDRNTGVNLDEREDFNPLNGWLVKS